MVAVRYPGTGTGNDKMEQDAFFTATWLPFLPGNSWAGLLVWLLVALGVVGFLLSLFRP